MNGVVLLFKKRCWVGCGIFLEFLVFGVDYVGEMSGGSSIGGFFMA